MEIDTIDYALLRTLQREGRMWKKKLHAHLQEQDDGLPGDTDMAVQTVGRRIDKLHDNALVESCIIKPNDLKRDLIIAYRVTEDGAAAVERKRREILHAQASTGIAHILAGTEPEDADTDLLVSLLSEELDVSAAERSFFEDATYNELVSFSHLYCSCTIASGQLSPDQLGTFLRMLSDISVSASLLDHLPGFEDAQLEAGPA